MRHLAPHGCRDPTLVAKLLEGAWELAIRRPALAEGMERELR